MNEADVYIVAVSGGVDSVVLLHKLVSRLKVANPSQLTDHDSPTYIVAHFDHGIRTDSKNDALLVRELAEKYGLDFELGEGHLNPEVSEADARDARYSFLRSVKQKHKAQKIVTAHHQDDLLETMIINIIRGTGPRGLAPMSGYDDLLRPLLNKKKSELIDYAKAENLNWNEDSTNQDEKYLRNYVRLNIMPKIEPAREKLLEINKNVENIYNEIDFRIVGMLPKQNMMIRSKFVSYEYSVQKEFIRAWLVRCGVKDIDSQLINRLVIATKTLPIGKKIDVNGNLWLLSQKQNVLLTSK
jgi:tRNA(Ile)-lysidine synthase